MAVDLPGLVGTTPVGFLAALGVLHAAQAVERPALAWAGALEPSARLSGIGDVETLVALIDDDRRRRLDSPVLRWGPGVSPTADLRLEQPVLRRFAAAVLDGGDRSDADLFCALVAEGAVAGTGESKPTHLHFTAGQQRFLDMVRHLASAVGPTDLEEALVGPWRYDSTLPTLGWDARGERLYALRATDPSQEKRTGVPGADWLAFVGLSFLPVVNRHGTLLTTGCDRAWKRGRLHWPLWEVPLTAPTIRSLLGDPSLLDESVAWRRARGVTQVLAAPIRRTDQGGYGSFGPTTLVPPVLPGASGDRPPGRSPARPGRTPRRPTGPKAQRDG